jgi:hypothetical protein
LRFARRCPTVHAMVSPRLDLRADQALLDRVDRVAALLSRPGAEFSRSSAARAAMLAGLDVIEAEHAARTPPGPAKGTTTPAKPAKSKAAKKKSAKK